MMRRIGLLVLILAAFGLLAVPSVGLAQQVPPQVPTVATPTAIEEIVITARKRETLLQETPVTINVLSTEAFVQQSIEDLEDAQYALPNVDISVGPATGSTVTINIRGQGGSGFTVTESPSVSIYVDDVLVTRSPGLLFDLIDMDRIEVLKGPQGTLFGQNTTAGTFRMISKLPDGTFNGWSTFGVGADDRYEAKGAVGFPILGETLSGRVAYMFRTREGFSRERPTGLKLPDSKVMKFRGSLRWQPTDNIDVVFVADRSKSRNTGTNAKLRAIEPDDPSAGLLTGLAPLFDEAQRAGLLPPQNGVAFRDPDCTAVPFSCFGPGVAGQQFLNDNINTTDGNSTAGTSFRAMVNGVPQGLTFGDRQNDDVWGFSLTTTVDFDTFTFRSISGHRRLRAARSAGQDGVPMNFFWSGDDTWSTAFQQEFHVFGTALEDRLKYTAGFWMYYEESTNDAYQALFPESTLVPPQPLGSTFSTLNFLNITELSERFARNYNWAPFLHLEYELSDRTTVSVGLRFSHERREADYRVSKLADGGLSRATLEDVGLPGGPIPLRFIHGFTPAEMDATKFSGECTLGTTIGDLCGPLGQSQRYNIWTWSASINRRFTDDMMGFFRASLSKRSGSWPPRPAAALGVRDDGTVINTVEATDPERLVQYEVGLKSDFWGGRGRANVGAYTGNFSDQLTSSIRIDPETGRTASFSVNSGRVKQHGVELELTLLPFDGMRFFGTFGHRSNRCVKNKLPNEAGGGDR